MKGYGFLIWLLNNVFPPSESISRWKEMGVEWVSVKIRAYTQEYNRLSGTNKLEDFLIACDEAGIKVGGWVFVHTTNLAYQAKLAAQDVKDFKLSHLMIDAEQNNRVYPGAYWKSYPRYRLIECARTYMDNLDVPDKFPVGLCTYRYPEVHREFPFEAFLGHPRMTMINPQMYWVGANNPGYQVAESLKQYRKISSLPFYPIGYAYEEHNEMPTAKEIAEFKEICQVNFEGKYGFYRWGHAKKHDDWLAAMKVEVDYPEPPPPPPPPPPVFKIPEAKLVPGISALSIRTGPSTNYGRVGYVTPADPTVEILERKKVSEATEWFRIGYSQWSAAQYNGARYLEEI